MLTISMSNKVYDILSKINRLILPLTEFITGIAGIWGLPWADKIVQTLLSANALLAVILKISKDTYQRQNYVLPSPEIKEEEADG